MNHLDVGEFVLLLPEHLRSEEEHYKSVFEDDLTSRISSKDERQQMTATVGYWNQVMIVLCIIRPLFLTSSF